MTQLLPRAAFRLLILVVAFVLAIAAFTFLRNGGWLSALGLESQGHDSQVVAAIKRTQEVSLLSLSMQGIDHKEQSRTLLGHSVPGTKRTLFLQYNFDAKLGLDGSRVKVTKTGEKAYRISVPKFRFIGYDHPKFQVAAEDGGALTWGTPDIDQTTMVNEILDDAHQQKYLDSNTGLLKEQTKVFYRSLITSVDPDIVTTFEFRT